jgi:hypothetical protein
MGLLNLNIFRMPGGFWWVKKQLTGKNLKKSAPQKGMNAATKSELKKKMPMKLSHKKDLAAKMLSKKQSEPARHFQLGEPALKRKLKEKMDIEKRAQLKQKMLAKKLAQKMEVKEKIKRKMELKKHLAKKQMKQPQH